MKATLSESLQDEKIAQTGLSHGQLSLKHWLQMIQKHTGNKTILDHKKTQRNKFTLENMILSSEPSTTSFYVFISHPYYDTLSPDRIFQLALKI